MKNHVYRPLFVVIGLVAIILGARAWYVPDDFGVHERGYRFGWHRQSNEQEWKDFRVKYQGKGYCANCHPDKVEMIDATPHTVISCENCHGPAGVLDDSDKLVKHGEDMFEKDIDRTREQCLRCHAYLPYEQSGRYKMLTIINEEHNPGTECVSCHNPHSPGLG